MTEPEIKTKLCCVQGVGELQGVHRYCVGSQCAGWRQTKAGVPDTKDADNNPIKGTPAEGYCGRAGPEQ